MTALHSTPDPSMRRGGMGSTGMSERWLLMSGETLVGSIDVIGADQPWFTGHFYPEPAFAQFADDFSRELAMVEGNLDEWLAEWEEVYRVSGSPLTGPDFVSFHSQLRVQLEVAAPRALPQEAPRYLVRVLEPASWTLESVGPAAGK